MSCPSDQVMGATGSVTCVSPPHVQRLEGDRKSFTRALVKDLFPPLLLLLRAVQGRETGPGRDLRPGGSGTRER